MTQITVSDARSRSHRAGEVFFAFLKLGLTSFGGPIAHLGFFRTEFVERRRWFDESTYADLVALCQFLPGPASSQVGIAIGILRAGYLGAVAAWVAFTLGAVMGSAPNGWAGAALCLVAIFLPSFLLVIGALPFWQVLRSKPAAQAMLKGVNAAVVGVLLAALYQPVWTAGILNARDFALAIVAFLLLFLWRMPPRLVVALCAVGGAAVL